MERLVYRRDEPIRMGGNGQNNLNGYLACATTDISDRVVQHHFQGLRVRNGPLGSVPEDEHPPVLDEKVRGGVRIPWCKRGFAIANNEPQRRVIM